MSVSIDSRIDEAVDRFHYLYDAYDYVDVSCSGGKDSTCMVEVAAICAKQRGIKIDVVFWDEEIIHPGTPAYMERLRKREEINVIWYCLPHRQNNAFSKDSPYWYPWDPAYKSVWARSIPEYAITEPPPGYHRELDLEDMTRSLGKARYPKLGVLALGRRAAESPVRKLIASKGWYTGISSKQTVVVASPIVDWGTDEVWNAIRVKGWDWNRAYLRMHQAGMNKGQLRVGPFFGEEPSVAAHLIRKHSPDAWKAAELRVPGVAMTARYARTSVLGRGTHKEGSDGSGVRSDKIVEYLNQLPLDKRLKTLSSMKSLITNGYALHSRPNVHHIMQLSKRGDTKGDRLSQARGVDVYIDAMKKGKYKYGTKKSTRHHMVNMVNMALEQGMIDKDRSDGMKKLIKMNKGSEDEKSD